jgi:enoyl-[acyl-carrier protein] reductase/trans-2-enoyl-CoA reductase (NAD+)
MSETVIKPRFRGFISLTTHPEGCAANVRSQVDYVKEKLPGEGLGNVLVIGSSTGYGLGSLLSAVWGYGAKALGVCFERPPKDPKPGSAGWYNLAEAHRLAREEGRQLETINGDAFSTEIKAEAIAALKERFGKIDLVVYSLASPKRTDPSDGTTYSSVLKPLAGSYTGKTIDLRSNEITEVTLETGTAEEKAATVKVMGGEDWQMWMDALSDADLLAEGCRTVAYSYIGPKVTDAIYRSGTIGAAKDDLEATARAMNASLQDKLGGNAWVSVNKALVTQASAAIPVVPLYISILFKVMKAKGTHEGTIEQMVRMFAEQIGPGKTPSLDEAGRIRIDDWELADDVQAEVDAVWQTVATDNFESVADFAGYTSDFQGLFGFGIDGIDYDAPTEVDRPLN